MRLASAVTLINVLVATGFSIIGLVRPDLIVPTGTMSSPARSSSITETRRKGKLRALVLLG